MNRCWPTAGWFCLCLLMILPMISSCTPKEGQAITTADNAQNATPPPKVESDASTTPVRPPDSMPQTPPGTPVQTQSGAFLVTLEPEQPPILIGKAQRWIATVTTSDYQEFVPTALYMDGGMPGHGHGLPSAPRFTRQLDGRRYLLEGLTLNMPGDWRFVVTVGGPNGLDTAQFDMNIQPAITTVGSADASWSKGELALIDSLRLRHQPPPTDASNTLLENSSAIELGEALFNEPGLSGTAEVSCATCHERDKAFADGKAFGFGTRTTNRHTPTLVGVAHANWFYWDGRRDSLWAQAITPIETPGEMDNNRVDAVRFVLTNKSYRDAFIELHGSDIDLSDRQRFPSGASPFGDGKLLWYRMATADQTLVNSAFATLGKVLASFETTLLHAPGRFDHWADRLLGNTAESNTLPVVTAKLTADEQAGLRLFLDLPRTQCLRCHNTPLFTNQGFHNVATSEPAADAVSSNSLKRSHDFGRMLGLQAVLVDPFNCSGEFSDAPDTCDHLRFARRQNLGETIDGAFKVPSLRNLAASSPYFHDGRFQTLAASVDHYRNQQGATEKKTLRVSEVPDIELTDRERDQLVSFLGTLDPVPGSR